MGKVQILQHQGKNTNKKRFLDDNGFHSLSLSHVSTSDPEGKAHKHPISSSFQISSSKEKVLKLKPQAWGTILFCCSHKNIT